MPFQSEAQRRYMYSQLPTIAARWEKETPKGKKLPKKLHPEESALHKYFKGLKVKY